MFWSTISSTSTDWHGLWLATICDLQQLQKTVWDRGCIPTSPCCSPFTLTTLPQPASFRTSPLAPSFHLSSGHVAPHPPLYRADFSNPRRHRKNTEFFDFCTFSRTCILFLFSDSSSLSEIWLLNFLRPITMDPQTPIYSPKSPWITTNQVDCQVCFPLV